MTKWFILPTIYNNSSSNSTSNSSSSTVRHVDVFILFSMTLIKSCFAFDIEEQPRNIYVHLLYFNSFLVYLHLAVTQRFINLYI
jgi:hypothetical protein